MICPEPPHCGQGWLIENSPWLWESIPRPPHRGQTLGAVPGFAPVPPQTLQVAIFGTVTETCAPSTACSNESWTSVSRSRPRVGALASRPPRLKTVEKMSPRSEAKPPAPGAPPNGARPPPKPANAPPASYSLRFSGSDSASYASWTSLKRSSAFGSPWLRSGWYSRASFR